MQKCYLAGIILAVLCFLVPKTAFTHGVLLSYESNGDQVEVLCRYDDGQLLSGANVTVFAPDDPTTPWLQGKTNQDGVFTFTPDKSRPGEWVIRARLDGHGGLARIPVEAGTGLWDSLSAVHWLMALSVLIFLAAVTRFRKTT